MKVCCTTVGSSHDSTGHYHHCDTLRICHCEAAEYGIMILDTSTNDKKERKRCPKEKDGRTRKSSS